MDELFLSGAEAARRVGVPASTFRAWAKRGRYITPVALPSGRQGFRRPEVGWLREQVRLNEAVR